MNRGEAGRRLLRIVIIDNRPSNRTLYAKAATSLGDFVQAYAFSSALGALRWLGRHPADLVISDLWTADLNGIELLTVLRKRAASVDVPVLIVTADASVNLSELVREAGAAALMRTPVSLQALQARLRDLLNLGR